jgi:hypothetical protein
MLTWLQIIDFDVNFYFAYLVVEKVIITTKHNHDEVVVWKIYISNFASVKLQKLHSEQTPFPF